MLRSPSHQDTSVMLYYLHLAGISESKLHSGGYPTLWDILCASIKTHSPPARNTGCICLIPNLSSQTSLLYNFLPALKAKLNLKQKHFPECSYSLNQHLHKLVHLSFAPLVTIFDFAAVSGLPHLPQASACILNCLLACFPISVKSVVDSGCIATGCLAKAGIGIHALESTPPLWD